MSDLQAENRELRAYLKAFVRATIEPEDRGEDAGVHEANPTIVWTFRHEDERDTCGGRFIMGGQVRRAMELVGFDKLNIEPATRTIAEELSGNRARAETAEAELAKARAENERLRLRQSELEAICNALRAALATREAEVTALRSRLPKICPFALGGSGPETLEADEPCPVCGDLGTFTAENMDRPSACIDRAALMNRTETGGHS